MSNLRPYLEDYVKTINHLLANYQDDDAIIDAAERLWEEEDPRYLVFIERGLYTPRMPFSPKDTAGGDVHRPNEIPTTPPATPPATSK